MTTRAKRRFDGVTNSSLGSSKSSVNKKKVGRMLCCICGTSMETNPSSMCIQCLRANVDITAGIPTQLILHQCRNCARFLGHSTASSAWVDCELESQELLAICLRKVTGLRKKVRLIDAAFEWTEPHSKRVKVILTVQKEVFDMVLQQKFKVTYVVQNQPCDTCVKAAAEGQWAAIVQVRQKVQHKRTIFFMEQKILKHNMHEKCAGIKPVPGAGLDFYFSDRSHARSMIAFLRRIIPLNLGDSRQLTTHDGKSNVYNFKYNFLVDIVPVSVDDLVVLPTLTAQKLGNICPLVLCHKISNVLHFIDPTTLARGELQTKGYLAEPFRALCSKNRLAPFVVLDVQPVRTSAAVDAARSCRGKFSLVEVTVARPDDVGDSTLNYTVVSHLGNFLQAGDTCLGYFLKYAVLNEDDLAGGVNRQSGARRNFTGPLPPVILVRKMYKRGTKKRVNRHWTLKRMPLQPAEGAGNHHSNVNDAKDFEDFMQDLEENPELRGEIDLYKNPDYNKKSPKKSTVGNAVGGTGRALHDEGDISEDDDDETDFPEIQLSELLDSIHLSPTTSAAPEDFVSGANGTVGLGSISTLTTKMIPGLPDEDDPDL